MALVVATIQNLTRQFWPQFFGQQLGLQGPGVTSVTADNPPGPPAWNPVIKYFKVGRGGWIDPGTGPVPRIPDPTLTDLDVIINPGRYVALAGNVLFLQKTLVAGGFTFEAPSTLKIRCLLDFPDFNDINSPPVSVNPDLWELGVFSEHPNGLGGLLMVAYGTFQAETKTVAKQVENDMRLIF